MMFKNVTPEKAISFTRLATALSCCWPLSLAATKHQVIRFKILRIVLTINAFALLLALLNSLYLHFDDSINIAKAGSLSFALIHVITQTLFCATQHDNFQRLIKEMIVYVQDANPRETGVFQSYVDKFSTFYAMSATWFYMSGVMVIAGTLLLPQPFPTTAEYPFSVEYEPISTIIFVHQAVAIMQCSSHTSVNVFGALLISCAAARIEILTSELRDVVNAGNLIESVKKYYRVRRYAQDVANAVQFIALITVTMCGLAVLLCGIVVVGRQPVTVKAQFLALAVTTLLEVFMCAWPADHLMHVSQSVAQGAYESTWYERSVKVQKLILCTMIPQEAVAISIKCVIPILSLRYFCSYISNIFSFFTALRLMLMEDESED
ncbi:uncharacterized protein LOC143376733 isoform X2 [Andrena cerasifolii]|uniref:uncharacterized protein LOC143376733 isoform X2 n=1 Tax=Andrena cerasifolii TaxID=2819439 RepID=UPI004038129D